MLPERRVLAFARLFKVLLASALIAFSGNYYFSAPVEAQYIPLGMGMNLGRNLLTAAARGHSNSSSNSSGSSSSSKSAASRNKKQAISAYNKSAKLFNSKKYEEAIPLLVQAVQIDPTMGNAYALLAVCETKTGQLTAAMQNFQQAQNYGNHYKSLQYEQGMCSARLRDYRFAQYCLQEYLAKNAHDDRTAEAQKALDIIQHNFVAQSNDDYLSDASRLGVRRWTDGAQPLRVYIQENPNLRGYHREFVPIVQQAFDDWSRGTNGRVAFMFVSEPSQAQIKVSWTDNEADMGGPDTKELGLTATTVSNGTIEAADIKLLTLVGYCRDDVNELFPQAKCVALHEIGHALGLQHSDSTFDTMYPLVPPKGLEFSLTRRDLNTVTALYSQSPRQVTSMDNYNVPAHSETAAQQRK